uniref:Uncharacterized protein n=1 Tax=Arundo donax TaxID=35708 RepID=A0A0A8YZF4_ARUDO
MLVPDLGVMQKTVHLSSDPQSGGQKTFSLGPLQTSPACLSSWH